MRERHPLVHKRKELCYARRRSKCAYVVTDFVECAFPSPAIELVSDSATVPSGANVVLDTLSVLPSSKARLPIAGSDLVSIRSLALHELAVRDLGRLRGRTDRAGR